MWACRYVLHWNLVFVIYILHKFIYILCKFCPLRSFDYSWNNNLIVLLCKRNICFILENFALLLIHFLVISTANIGKVVSMLFSQRWSNEDEQTQFSFKTKYQSWNNIDLLTLNQRNSFNVVSTLFYQRWNNVDKHTLAQLSFSTNFQHWNNIVLSSLNRRNSIDVISTLFCQRWNNVDKWRRLNFLFQPNISVETMLMNVDNQDFFNIDSSWCFYWECIKDDYATQKR